MNEMLLEGHPRYLADWHNFDCVVCGSVVVLVMLLCECYGLSNVYGDGIIGIKKNDAPC